MNQIIKQASRPQFIREKTQYFCTLYSPESIDTFLEKYEIKSPILCGRSNVGKSTFINALFRNKIAKASKTPGKTREIQVFTAQTSLDPEKKVFVFDLPGFGHAKVSKVEKKRWDDLMNYFFNALPPSQLILHLLDSRNPRQKNDQEFRDFIQKFPFEYWAVFNKIDKFKNQKERNQFKSDKKDLKLPHVYAISALKKRSIEIIERDLISFFTGEDLEEIALND